MTVQTRARRAILVVSASVALMLIATVVYFERGPYQSPPVASPEPANAVVLVSPDANLVKVLRASPDGLAPLSPGEACPVSTYARPDDPEFPPGLTLGGGGPLWLQGLESPLTAGVNQSVSWVAPNRSGFYLVRGRRLDGSGLVLFSNEPFGSPTAHDLVLPRQVSAGNTQWVTWQRALVVVPSGCYGLSISYGSAAPEIIVFHAISV